MKACFLIAAAAAALVAAAPAEAGLEPAECAVAAAPQGASCGVLRVPEDRSRPGGRELELHYVIAPGSDRALEPILFIAGGPGQSAIDVMPAVLADLRAIDPRRDIVFLDQRGTGRSNPLGCEQGFELIEQGPGSAPFEACVAALRAHADLGRYGTADAVADLEALRSALGHERVNLVAGSYGTRVALYYMREHPGRVRSAILRAAAPLDFNILAGGIAAADAELGRVLDECAAEAACAAAFPGLEDRVRALAARVAAAPETVTVQGADGAARSFEVNDTLFQQMLYALLLAAPSRQQLPLVVATAERAGFQPLAPMLDQIRRQLYGGIPVGMYLGVVCAEDAPRIGPEGIAPGRTAITGYAAMLVETCRAWPVEAAAPGHLDQPSLATPTLIVSGTLDPATTAASAGRLAASLERSAHVVVPATAHGPLLPQCVMADAARFLERGSAEGLAPDCSAMALAPFAVPATAAAPQAPAGGPAGGR